MSFPLTLVPLIRDHHLFICFRLRWDWTTDGQVSNEIIVNQTVRPRLRLKARHGLDDFHLCGCAGSFFLSYTSPADRTLAFFIASSFSFSLFDLILLLSTSSIHPVESKSIVVLLGVYRRTPKETHPIQAPPPQSASTNSKQPLATGTDTGRSSSARVPKK